MPRRGRHRKKTRTHVVEADDNVRGSLLSNDELRVPRSLVLRRGKVEPELIDLVADLRNLMRPHTASNFKEDARNRKMTLARYATALGSSMGVTHLLALSQNGPKITLRIGRTPGGPTLSFRVKRFSLGGHVRSAQRRPYDSSRAYESPPIVVTNNFGDQTAAPHVKLMRITFQNMFPAVDVGTVKLGDCRRVVLFNFVRREVPEEEDGKDASEASEDKASAAADGEDDDLEDEEVEVRHYAIRARPVGVDRKVRRIVESKIPDLSRLGDISEYIAGGGAAAVGGEASDSEPEDEATHVVLPSKFRGKGNNAAQKSALKLVELGPRLRLKLYKVERGLAGGDVMYHAYVSKTPREARELKERKEGEVAAKKRRREEQEANVERKRAAKEEKQAERERKRKKREEVAMARLRGEAGVEEGGPEGSASEGDDESDEGSDARGDESGSDGGEAPEGEEDDGESEGESSDEEGSE